MTECAVAGSLPEFRPEDVLAEIRRVLRPAGRLFVLDACFFPLVRQIVNLALRVRPHDGDYHFYTSTQAAGLLANVGFEVEDRERGFGAFLLIAVNR